MKGGTAINVAVVGATGAVGETMIKILEQRDFPVAQLFLSERALGGQSGYVSRQSCARTGPGDV